MAQAQDVRLRLSRRDRCSVLVYELGACSHIQVLLLCALIDQPCRCILDSSVNKGMGINSLGLWVSSPMWWASVMNGEIVEISMDTMAGDLPHHKHFSMRNARTGVLRSGLSRSYSLIEIIHVEQDSGYVAAWRCRNNSRFIRLLRLIPITDI